MFKKSYFPFLFLGFGLISATGGDAKKTLSEAPIKGVDINSMDPNLTPCDNFYQYANGSWIKNNPIPETEASWSNFNMVLDKNDSILKNILEKAATTKNIEGSAAQKIGDFYKIAMDTAALNKMGFTPLQKDLQKINALKDKAGVVLLASEFQRKGISVLFTPGVGQDSKISQQYAFWIDRGEMGLPDKEYYLGAGDKPQKIRDEYKKHITKMFVLLGYKENVATEKAGKVLDIETRMAKACLSNVDQRNPELTYNKISLVDLSAKYPGLYFNQYAAQYNLPVKEVILTEPNLLKEMENLVTESSIEDLKTLFEWNLITATADKLSNNFNEENFRFYATTMRGVAKMKPRWKKVLQQSNQSLGELLGQEYVKVAFSEANKKKVNEMVAEIVKVMGVRLQNLDWMSAETKVQALKKLNTLAVKMGYPDEWKDFSSLQIKQDAYVLNWFRCNEFTFNADLNKLGKPLNRKEWNMAPQIVNAYYNPTMNEIVFPAGILQPPFFDVNRDDAANYGSMGAVIGHEITHGFDDTGNQFDAEGNLKNWWTKEDREKFNERTKVLADQYSKYEAVDSAYVNGFLTLGENIADLGGLSIAYEAYMNSLIGKEQKVIDGYTPEQRFFIAFGQVWKNNSREKAIREQVMIDPHSPAKFRVVGVVANMPEFEKAFSCGNPDAKANEPKVKIW